MFIYSQTYLLYFACDMVTAFCHRISRNYNSMASIPVIKEGVIQKVLLYRDLIPAVREALTSFSNGDAEQPVRQTTVVKKHEGYLMSMAAYMKQQDALSMKVISLYPQNPGKDLPMHQCHILHFNAADGSISALMEAETITKMRTAAASAVATMIFAPPNSRVLGILGAGGQAESHIHALCSVHKYDKILLWNSTEERGRQLVSKLKIKHPALQYCASAEETVSNADVVTTVTSSKTPVVMGKWLKQAVHINCVGACRPDWRELDDDCMDTCDLYVDSRAGALVESGDVILSKKEISGEIGEVLAGKVNKGSNSRTIFKSLGMAVEDVAAASLVWKKICSDNAS